MSKKRKDNAVQIEGPPIARDTHVQNWYATNNARARGEHDGWTNAETPIHQAYLKCRLNDQPGNEIDAAAERRWQAYLIYKTILHKSFPRGTRASYAAEFVNGTTGFPPGQDAMAERCDEAKKLVSIDSHMSQKDRKIVRLLSEGETLADAVRVACGEGFKDTVSARVRDALDALEEAVTAARDGGYRYVRMTGS